MRRIAGDDELAQDYAQEAWIRAIRALPSFRGESRFSTWLHRIAVNCAMDELRRRKRRGEREEREGERAELVESTEPGPERLARGAEVQSRLRSALGGLSPTERTAFVLRHFEGRSIAEISQTLGAGVSATKHAVFRAVRKVRRELEPLMEVPHA